MSNWKGWLEAGKKLAIFPESIVCCPDCQSDNLKVVDVTLTEDCSEFERIMYCVSCKAQNSLKMNGREKYRPPAQDYTAEEKGIVDMIISSYSFSERASKLIK